ncbi:MAG: SUMF1/EgtB/PvdO family nonheme iron enzyme, partial [Planctomycetes bacterium]|nr:SUMF1/EgtB/PvdO family nonheme iron enzyme [Planctomycetota bacterium]
WYSENSSGVNHDVGTRQTIQFGFYDMHGNVGEWCRDVFNGGFYDDIPAFAYGPDPSNTCDSGNTIHVGVRQRWPVPIGRVASPLA